MARTSSTTSPHLRPNCSTLTVVDSFTEVMLLFMVSTCKLQTRHNILLSNLLDTKANGKSAGKIHNKNSKTKQVNKK